MKSLKNGVNLIFNSLTDLVIRILPNFSNTSEYRYAFLVHPRNIKDVYRKYSLLRIVPSPILYFILRFYWPIVLSHVTGLKSKITGREIRGMILTIPLTARQMLENRSLAVKKIKQAVILAKKHGVKLIGLGGLTSSLTKGGQELIEIPDSIYITTGHAYTAFNVTENLFRLSDILDTDKRTTLVAIVGAAGSVGSTSAKLIARRGFANVLLIDLERKKLIFPDLINEMKRFNPDINVSVSHQIKDIYNADYIVTATNAPEVLIKSVDLKSGAVVIDDAQPSDVSPEALRREDILVIEAGIVHTPEVSSHFNFNLKDKHDNFCCMAEVLILASIEHKNHYVINRATIDAVDEISAQGNRLGFHIAEFQNYNESIKSDRIIKIRKIIHEKSTIQP